MKGGIVDLLAGVGAAGRHVEILPVEAGTGSHVELAPQNGFDAVLFSRLEELDGSEEIAMVRHGNGRHAHLTAFFHERTDLVRSVEKAVLRVQMKMDKLFSRIH